MEKKSIKNKPAIKYFEKYITKNQDINNNNKANKKEKIKLIFKLINGKSNHSYKLFLENQDKDGKNESVSSDPIFCSNSNIIHLLEYNYDYNFSREQKLRIVVMITSQNEKNKYYQLLFTIGEIVGSENSIKQFYIKNNNKDEILEIKSLNIKAKEEYVTIHFLIKISSISSQTKIPETQIEEYFKNEEYKIYFQIEKDNIILYESEVFTDDGKFNIVQIPLEILNSDFSVIFFNSKKNYISKIETSVSQITNQEKKNQNKLFFSKQLTLNDKLCIYNLSSIREKISFLDYLKNGVRIALDIGIDFTASNGHPEDLISNHCCIPYKKNGNPYERAILSCANIMANYDYDQLFPVYGFGAIIEGQEKASMCFNINFKDDPNIKSVNNIIKEYHKCLDRIKLSYPTYFAPLINKIINEIKKEEDILEYHVLMILTDGIIDDYQDTVDALVEGSFLPLSVIIIGIGNIDFKEMEDLDGDDKPLISRSGKKRQRDLVQFVPFDKFKGDEKKLTEEFLDEIPRQIIEYYTLNFLYPETLSNNNANNDNNNEKESQNQILDIKENKSTEIFTNTSYKLINSNNELNNYNNNINNNISNNINNNISNNFNNNISNNFNNNINNNLNNNISNNFNNNNFNNNINNNFNNNKYNNNNNYNSNNIYNNNNILNKTKHYYTYRHKCTNDSNLNNKNNTNLNNSNSQLNKNNNNIKPYLNNNIQNNRPINTSRNISRINNNIYFNNNSKNNDNYKLEYSSYKK